MVKVIIPYSVSQRYTNQAGELIVYKQQYRSLLRRGEISLNPNPRKIMLLECKLITVRRNNNELNEIILMMDANEDIAEKSNLAKFARDNDMVDCILICDPQLANDSTYINMNNRIDYIFIFPNLVNILLTAGHYLSDQHIISHHKGIYARFREEDIFHTKHLDSVHCS